MSPLTYTNVTALICNTRTIRSTIEFSCRVTVTGCNAEANVVTSRRAMRWLTGTLLAQNTETFGQQN